MQDGEPLFIGFHGLKRIGVRYSLFPYMTQRHSYSGTNDWQTV
jgi:hypothetical protein